MRHPFVLSLLAALAITARAETAEPPPPPGLAPTPDGAPVPSEATADELAPEITIVEKERETVEEYRLNGQLYMIKVKPIRGPEYFLLDADGDGQLETRSHALDPRLLVPSWMILKW